MKRILPGLVIVLLLVGWGMWRNRAVPTPAVFDPRPLAQVQADAEARGAVLLVKATASWCGPCRVMDRETFAAEPVAAAIRAAGLAAHVDIDQYPEAARAWGVQGVPTTIVFRGGKEIGRVEGFLPPDAFRAWFEGVVAAK
ncbi:MAG: thioredoxin family protein [Phycisphaerae bacterium]|nr:thioredoxin family protein [Phycisphaerae bacterium]